MADEQENKRWQFSLKRAFEVTTVICVWLALSGAAFRMGFGFTVVIVVAICSVVGAIRNGTGGAIDGAGIGLAVICVVVIILEIIAQFF